MGPTRVGTDLSRILAALRWVPQEPGQVFQGCQRLYDGSHKSRDRSFTDTSSSTMGSTRVGTDLPRIPAALRWVSQEPGQIFQGCPSYLNETEERKTRQDLLLKLYNGYGKGIRPTIINKLQTEGIIYDNYQIKCVFLNNQIKTQHITKEEFFNNWC